MHQHLSWLLELTQIPTARLTEPGVTDTWSVHDLLAHMLHWQSFLCLQIQAVVNNDVPPRLTSESQADIDQIRIDQLEMAQAVDEAIGGSTTFGIVGIMEHLRNLGLADNTIVIYFADNGWLWGEHRMRAKNKPLSAK